MNQDELNKRAEAHAIEMCDHCKYGRGVECIKEKVRQSVLNRLSEFAEKHSETKTAEEILISKIGKLTIQKKIFSDRKNILIDAMHEFSTQQNNSLHSEIASLKSEVDRLKKKEILGDRKIVELEHTKTSLKSEVEKAKELLNESLTEISKYRQTHHILGHLGKIEYKLNAFLEGKK